MDFVTNFVDYGAPEFVVATVATVEFITAGQIRVTYVTRRRNETIAVCHLVWDRMTYLASGHVFEQARTFAAQHAPGRSGAMH